MPTRTYYTSRFSRLDHSVNQITTMTNVNNISLNAPKKYIMIV